MVVSYERFGMVLRSCLQESRLIPIYIQQDATLHSLFYLETALHVSVGTSTHHQERIQLYLQHLVIVIPLLLSAGIVEELERYRQIAVTV